MYNLFARVAKLFACTTAYLKRRKVQLICTCDKTPNLYLQVARSLPCSNFRFFDSANLLSVRGRFFACAMFGVGLPIDTGNRCWGFLDSSSCMVSRLSYMPEQLIPRRERLS